MRHPPREPGARVKRHPTALGLVAALLAAATFGLSGSFMKPLLEAGWTPAAAVTVRALLGGFVLVPIAFISIRGRWDSLWRARWRVLGMGVIGVAATQFAYSSAVQRIPVDTAILIEYMAPLLLVLAVWVRNRRTPQLVVLLGSLVALAGLFFVVGPAIASEGTRLDPLGLLFAVLAMVGCALYFVIAARPSDGLPPVMFACASLLVGGAILVCVGVLGLAPIRATFTVVHLLGTTVPWWVPLIVLGVFATAIAYVTSIAASEILGSRVSSFLGMLEVVAATAYAWLVIGENLTIAKFVGGLLILAGIALVRAEKSPAVLEPSRARTPVESSGG